MAQEVQNQNQEIGFISKHLFLRQGAQQLYNSAVLNQDTTLQSMIPLDHDICLENLSQKFYNRLGVEHKKQYSAFDIWCALAKTHSTQVIKSSLFYTLVNFFLILQGLLFIKAFDLKQNSEYYRLAVGICLIWLYDIIAIGLAFQQMGVTAGKIKGTILYSIYKQLFAIESSVLRRQMEAKVINALTQFYNILQQSGDFILRGLSSSLAVLGISILIIVRLGWASLLAVLCCILFEIGQNCFSGFSIKFLDGVAHYKDKRMSYLSEVLSFLQYIKMQSWQSLFSKRIGRIRGKQMKGFIQYGVGLGLHSAFGQGVDLLSIYITISVLSSSFSMNYNSKYIVETAFLIFLLRKALNVASVGISSYFKLNRLFTRVANIFSSSLIVYKKKQPEDQQIYNKLEMKNKQQFILQTKNLNIFYEAANVRTQILSNLKLQVKKGEFILIVGGTGSGKSTLLDALANQIHSYFGVIQVKGTISYVEQDASILPGTLKYNITLTDKVDQKWYNIVLDWCCLHEELSSFPHGDKTILNERSKNITGGQKSRIALARALYSKRDIALLDDPLNSLDVRTAQAIFDNIGKFCRYQGKTIIMTISHTNFFADAQRIYSLANKQLKRIGKKDLQTDMFVAIESLFEQSSHHQTEQFSIRATSLFFQEQKQQKLVPPNQNYQPEKQLPEEEELFDGQTTQLTQTKLMKTLRSYFFNNKINWVLLPLTFLLYILSQVLITLSIIIFTKCDQIGKVSTSYTASQMEEIILSSQASGIYTNWQTYRRSIGMIAFAVFILFWLKYFFLNLCIQISNQALYNKAIKAVLGSYLNAFNKQSLDDVLHKFSIDLEVLDVNLVKNINCQMVMIFKCFVGIIFLSTINVVFLIFVLLMMVQIYVIHSQCSPVILQQRRISLQCKGSSIQDGFSSAIKCVKQIKIYNLQDHFCGHMSKLLLNSMKATISQHKTFTSYFTLNRYIYAIIQMGMIFFTIKEFANNDVGLLLYSFMIMADINDFIYWIPANSILISSVVTSIKRMDQFTQNKSTYNQNKSTHNQNNQKPKKNEEDRQICSTSRIRRNENIIDINKLTVKFGRTVALHNINIEIEQGKKIAIIGRTGSGKSTFIQSLYRLVQAEGDLAYFINGRNTESMNNGELRCQFCCIPQNPFVFKDTIRANIDPLNQYSEEQIKEVLRKVQLWQFVQNSKKGLNSSIENNQVNLSNGQMQLIGLTRVLLAKKAILIIDEPTSNIDQKTEQLISRIIREQFRDRTIITIVHKLLTTVDFDQVVVFDKGRIVQRGHAYQLLQRRQLFYSIVMQNQEAHQKMMSRLKSVR